MPPGQPSTCGVGREVPTHSILVLQEPAVSPGAQQGCASNPPHSGKRHGVLPSLPQCPRSSLAPLDIASQINYPHPGPSPGSAFGGPTALRPGAADICVMSTGVFGGMSSTIPHSCLPSPLVLLTSFHKFFLIALTCEGSPVCNQYSADQQRKN